MQTMKDGYSRLERDFLGNEKLVHYDGDGKMISASQVTREADGSMKIVGDVPAGALRADDRAMAAAQQAPQPVQPEPAVSLQPAAHIPSHMQPAAAHQAYGAQAAASQAGGVAYQPDIPRYSVREEYPQGWTLGKVAAIAGATLALGAAATWLVTRGNNAAQAGSQVATAVDDQASSTDAAQDPNAQVEETTVPPDSENSPFSRSDDPSRFEDPGISSSVPTVEEEKPKTVRRKKSVEKKPVEATEDSAPVKKSDPVDLRGGDEKSGNSSGDDEVPPPEDIR
jgi:hypothetical protein